MLVNFYRQAEATLVQRAKSSYSTGLTDSSFHFSTSQADYLLNKVPHLSPLWKNAEGVHEKAQKGTLSHYCLVLLNACRVTLRPKFYPVIT